MNFRNYSVKDVDSYIVGYDPKFHPKMEELRKIIKLTIPQVEERISWGIPFYRYYGLLGGFAAFPNHISFGLAYVLENEVRKTLEEKGYKTGKKTIQIRFNQKVPTKIIKQILKAKVKNNVAGRVAK